MMTLPTVQRFPVFIPEGFEPLEVCTRKGKVCPGQNKDDGYRPRWGGGFDAVRHGGRKHSAVDIMAAVGAHALSVDDGYVEWQWVYRGESRLGAGTSHVGGNYVRVRHSWGVSYYAHLHALPLVKPGQPIKAGQLLGYIGRTGNAAPGCPHLHLSFTFRGKLVDPVPYLQPLYEREEWR